MAANTTGPRKRHKIRHGDSPGSDTRSNEVLPNQDVGKDYQKYVAFCARDEALRSLATCKICFRMLYEPYTLGCGHTYCYSCLCQWFQNAERSKKTCPDCRAHVTKQPAPAYALREIVRELLHRPALLPANETVAEHDQNRTEEAATVEQDKANNDPAIGGLFKGTFLKSGHQQDLVPIYDAADGVTRCPGCAWELEGHGVLGCTNCGMEFYESEEDDSFSGTLSETSDSGSDGQEIDVDFDMHDAEFDQTIAAAMGYPMPATAWDSGEDGFPRPYGFSPPAPDGSSGTYHTAESDPYIVPPAPYDEDQIYYGYGGYGYDEDAEDEEEDSMDGFIDDAEDGEESQVDEGSRVDEESQVDEGSQVEDESQVDEDSDSSEGSASTAVQPSERTGRPTFSRPEPVRRARRQHQGHYAPPHAVARRVLRRVVEESSDDASDIQRQPEGTSPNNPLDCDASEDDSSERARRIMSGGRSRLEMRLNDHDQHDAEDELSEESSAEDTDACDDDESLVDPEFSVDDQSISEEERSSIGSSSEGLDDSESATDQHVGTCVPLGLGRRGLRIF